MKAETIQCLIIPCGYRKLRKWEILKKGDYFSKPGWLTWIPVITSIDQPAKTLIRENIVILIRKK